MKILTLEKLKEFKDSENLVSDLEWMLECYISQIREL